MKSKVDQLDIDKFKNVPSGLSSSKSKVDKLRNVPSKSDKLDIYKLEMKLDDLEKKVKIISMEGLTADLIISIVLLMEKNIFL